MKPGIHYEFHHAGYPTVAHHENERFSPRYGIYTADNPGKFRLQRHRFTPDSPLHPLLKTVPHVAFKVSDLCAAIDGEEVILGPYEPLDGYFVAVINDAGIPVELIQTELSDEELWRRSSSGKGALYREQDD